MSLEAFNYLNKALDIIQKNYYKRSEIDWKHVRDTAYLAARYSEKPADTYTSIRVALDELQDRHSFFFAPEGMEKFEDLARKNNPSPTGYIIQDRIAYINLPGFVASDNEEIKAFASTIDGIIPGSGQTKTLRVDRRLAFEHRGKYVAYAGGYRARFRPREGRRIYFPEWERSFMVLQRWNRTDGG